MMKWETALKDVLKAWMLDPDSPFSSVQHTLRSTVSQASKLPTFDEADDESDFRLPMSADDGSLSSIAFPLLNDLHKKGALPALMFNYDRLYCEKTAFSLLQRLELAEKKWKEGSLEWKQKMAEYHKWKRTAARKANTAPKMEEGMSKMDAIQAEASREAHPMQRFDVGAHILLFSFADHSKLLPSELEQHIESLANFILKPGLTQALRRGIGVHHAGMNRVYRQV